MCFAGLTNQCSRPLTRRLMETLGVLMNFLEFIASLVDSLAWPGVVCVFLWTFQERIGSLLPRLVRFKHKDTELEFSEAIERLERIEQPAIEGAVYEAEPNEQYLELLKIAEISP